jgi:hypothetical protein
MKAEGVLCNVVFVQTSPGGKDDVVTARVELRDPETGDVVLEKFSTLYPASWSRERIEQMILEAHADARNRGRITDNCRWEGRTRDGMRIDGYMSYDRRAIATAFPVYVPPREGRRRP